MKYSVLDLLKEAAPDHVTGAEIGERFGVSRTMVWKYIKELRHEGYSIDAAPNRGYKLLPSVGLLNPYEIANGLATLMVGKEVLCFDTLPSTNKYAARLAYEGCIDGLTVVADRQTSGRGRLGRNWESKAGKGIYMSMVLRPPMTPAETQIFTLATAVAAVKAIYKTTRIKTAIKWPNDIVADGKKVCGILLEMNSEADRVNYIVIGIGINYSQTVSDFTSELHDKATSILLASKGNAGPLPEVNGLTDSTAGRLALIRSVLREVDAVTQDILEGSYYNVLDLWREHSATLGREVRFTLRDEEYMGTAVDITTDGSLMVDCSDGVRRELTSGEVSVRGIYGYV